MRRVVYSVAMSLDGYIAGPQGEHDWIVPDPDVDFGALFGRFDAALMGRKTYEVAQRQGGSLGRLEVFVASRTLARADCPDVTVTDDPAATIAALKATPGKDIWLFGGGALFRHLLDLRLIDAVEVSIVPVLLGGGLPMLPAPALRSKLKLTSQRVYEKTGTVRLEYAVS